MLVFLGGSEGGKEGGGEQHDRKPLVLSAGVANSGLVLDVCGVCGGDGRSCLGCDGVPRSGMELDSCGICGGIDPHCLDPYSLTLLGGGACDGSIAVVRWQACRVKVSHVSCLRRALADLLLRQAPSNHSSLVLRIGSSSSACGGRWVGGEGEPPTDKGWAEGAGASAGWGTNLVSAFRIEAGFGGCGEVCTAGWAAWQVNIPLLRLSDCSSDPLLWDDL